MILSLIAAMARNRVIGRDNQLPWHLKADLQRFKALTLGHHLIMGRKTFESIGRPLPGRTSVVVTHRRDFAPAGVKVAHSVEEALALAPGDEEVFVAGGAQLYAQILGRADRLYLTVIDRDIAGDTYFPWFDPAAFREVAREPHAEGELPFSFVTYQSTGR